MLRRILRVLEPRQRRSPAPGRPIQSGAIPYVWVDGEPVYLLVTSRRTGRWIFPKGEIARSLGPAASAAREAFEEAGVMGRIGDEPVGVYQTRKVEREGQSRMIAVHLYALEVERRLADWPERRSRRRAWATLRQARRMIDNPGLFKLLKALHRRLVLAPPTPPPIQDTKRSRKK